MTEQRTDNNTLNRINEYFLEAEELSKNLILDINKIQKVGQSWTSKLTAENLQKKSNNKEIIF